MFQSCEEAEIGFLSGMIRMEQTKVPQSKAFPNGKRNGIIACRGQK